MKRGREESEKSENAVAKIVKKPKITPVVSKHSKYENPQFNSKLTQYYYIDQFLNGYNNLIKLFPYKKCKEISESMSAVNCLYEVLKVDRTRYDTVCYVIGDGTTPRTGACVAYSSAFKVFSIDPIMKMKFNSYVKKLTCFRGRAETKWEYLRNVNILGLIRLNIWKIWKIDIYQ